MTKLKKGDKVMVLDPGLIRLYETMKRFDPKAKPGYFGWVDEVIESENIIMVTFPIGDDDPEEHSQIAPYPMNQVVKSDWE